VAGVGILGEQGRMRPVARGTSDRDYPDVEPDLKPWRFGSPLIGAVAGRRVSTLRGTLKGSIGPYPYACPRYELTRDHDLNTARTILAPELVHLAASAS
jgi:hypothetical protein